MTEQSDRLQRVLDARRDAEGFSATPSRLAGAFGLAMAALEFAPSMPFILPYALYCLASAFVMLDAYLHVKRAGDRRAAPLVRRSPFEAMPPLVIAALAAALVGVAVFAAYPPYRAGSIGVAIAMAILAWIAWRIAGSRAILFGDDPQMEYAVDERLRLSRVTGAAALACAPAVVLTGSTTSWISSNYHTVGLVAMTITYAAFCVAMLGCALARRQLSARLAGGVAG